MHKVRQYLAIAISIFVLILIIGKADAVAQNTIHVPADRPSIQDAIFSSNNGDTIIVAPGSYFEHIDFVGRAVVVESSDGPAVTTIFAQNAFAGVSFGSGE